MTAELRQLWTVESGSYSDWRIHAVFETKADAKAWAAHLRGMPDSWLSDADVGRLTLVPKGVAPFTETTYSLMAELWDDGRVGREWSNVRTESAIDHMGERPRPRPRVRYVRAPVHANKGGRIEVEGSDEQAVRKVYSERLAMWKAGAWGGPNHQELIETNVDPHAASATSPPAGEAKPDDSNT